MTKVEGEEENPRSAVCGTENFPKIYIFNRGEGVDSVPAVNFAQR